MGGRNMEKTSFVDHLFKVLDETSLILMEELGVSYLEALAMTGENIYKESIGQSISQDTVQQLETLYSDFYQDGMTDEEVRRAFQLTVLKGMKEGTQPNHQMTPDAIALFISYLVNKVTGNQEEYKILDPAVGTGNLLTAIINHSEKKGTGLGVEVDPDLLRLAETNVNLQQKVIELFHQDSLRPLFIDPVEIVVCEPPVGYYTDRDNANKFQLSKTEEKPYSHFLMIEQGLNYTKPGGYLLYLVPNDLFEADKEKVLQQFLKDEAVILGLLQLPLSLFKDPVHAKSILLLRKKGPDVHAPSQVLLAELPKFTNQQALAQMIGRIDDWFTDYNKI